MSISTYFNSLSAMLCNHLWNNVRHLSLAIQEACQQPYQHSQFLHARSQPHPYLSPGAQVWHFIDDILPWENSLEIIIQEKYSQKKKSSQRGVSHCPTHNTRHCYCGKIPEKLLVNKGLLPSWRCQKTAIDPFSTHIVTQVLICF